MLPESHIPTLQPLKQSKRRLAKSTLIALPEILASLPPNTPYPEILADEPTKPISATIGTRSFLPLSPQPPVDCVPVIMTVTQPQMPPSPKYSANVSIDHEPMITTVTQPQMPPSPPSPPSPPLAQSQPRRKRKQPKPAKKKLGVLFASCCIILVIAVVFMGQGNGVAGAWMADTLRGFVGPTITAQVESWYLGLSNSVSQMQYQLGNQQVNTPWKVTTKVAHPTPTPIPLPTPPTWSTLSPMLLPSMTPLVASPLDGEGAWTVQDKAPAPYDYLPLDAKAFIRPDPSHPYAIVTLLQFDNRFTSLHIVSGITEPGGPRGMHGSGVIPASDVQENTLLAAFNGGFKYSDGQYGLMTGGVVYVPPQPSAATIAITKEGNLILGEWGVNPLLNSQNTDLVAWRQNGALLINQGMINPLTHDGAAWGGTILNSAYTWRSAIGITAQGTLLYAAGNALTAETLGEALKAAGAVTAMQTDINPFWVRAFLYNRGDNGQLTSRKLNPQMQGTGYEYLYSNQRDFFYLTRFAPAVPPVNNQRGTG